MTRRGADELPPVSVIVPARDAEATLLAALASILGYELDWRPMLDRDGRKNTITRAWVPHRARRAGGSAADYGASRWVPLHALRPAHPVKSRDRAGAGP